MYDVLSSYVVIGLVFRDAELAVVMVKTTMLNMINDPLSEYHEMKKINCLELIGCMHFQTANTIKFGSKNA